VPPREPCRICGRDTSDVDTVYGRFSRRNYRLRRCDSCGYAYIADPWTEYETIYDQAYYRGEGADRLVDYAAELHDQTIRTYEWEGITRHIAGLTGRASGLRWLDFGCGTGGLVNHANAVGHEALGYEPSPAAAGLRPLETPMVENLDEHRGEFDVVTAIEVIEHTLDPLIELGRIKPVLREGGLLFLTTGNAAPYRERLATWRYVTPEIHVSFFEPRTLELALSATGFTPSYVGRSPGFDRIMKYKVLKNLGVARRSVLTDLLPSRPVATVADRITRLSAHPVGWIVGHTSGG
jgi:SAM-dependent methyltransferase